MNNRSHQSQHAARTLKLQQGGPIGVEPVEDLGMDRERGLNTLLVVRIATLAGEFCALRPIEIRKRSSRHVTLLEMLSPCQWLEEAPPNDFKSFLSGRWSPRRLEAAHNVA